MVVPDYLIIYTEFNIDFRDKVSSFGMTDCLGWLPIPMGQGLVSFPEYVCGVELYKL